MNRYRLCISFLPVLFANAVSTLTADSSTNATPAAGSSTNELSKISLIGIISHPKPGLVCLEDHRFDPRRKYSLKEGQTTNGLTVTRIDIRAGVVEVTLGG